MIKLKVPASAANLGPGFDCLGLALALYNSVEVSQAAGFKLEIEGEGANTLSLDINNNLFFQAYWRYFQEVEEDPVPVKAKLINHIPLARGLGSSAATVVAGLKSAAYFAQKKLGEVELLNLAASLEGHADNVAAALFGGLVLTYQEKNCYQRQKLDFNSQIGMLIIIPQQQLKTKVARQVLPKQISLETAVFNLSRVVLLAKAFAKADFKLLTVATQDKLHQPYRQQLIRQYSEVAKIASKIGLPALVISGAGPSLLAFCRQDECQELKAKLEAEFNLINFNSQVKVVSVAKTGAELREVG